MKRDIIVEVYPWESRVAIVEDGHLAEIFWANDNESVGNIYKGRVKDVLPGLSCAFIDIGLAKNAFLYANDVVLQGKNIKVNAFDMLKSGQDIMVQVKKEAFSEKGARVTSNLSIPGHFLVLLPFQTEVSVSRKIICSEQREHLRSIIEKNRPSDIGVILRTACKEAEDSEILAELQELLEVWEDIRRRYRRSKAPSLLYEDMDVVGRTMRDYLDGDISRVIVNNSKLRDKIASYMKRENVQCNFAILCEEGDLFLKYGLEKDIRKVLRRKIWLKSGGYLIFDRTEAMTVIDVNSGKYTGNRGFEDSIYHINMEAAVEIPRQLRLRSLGGIILIDFIDMKDKDNEKNVIAAFKNELEKDKAHTRVIGITGLGFLEMTRKKSRYGVAEFFTEECSYCNGRGRTINLFALACEVKRKLANMGYMESKEIICNVHPELLEYITKHEGDLDYIEKRSKKKVKLVANLRLGLTEYNICAGEV